MKKGKSHLNIISDVKNEIKNIHNIDLDGRVVDLIATHPFLFTAEKMRDDNDARPIRHRYLFIIAIYRNKKKELLQSKATTN